jgi:hypothetical protein
MPSGSRAENIEDAWYQRIKSFSFIKITALLPREYCSIGVFKFFSPMSLRKIRNFSMIAVPYY